MALAVFLSQILAQKTLKQRLQVVKQLAEMSKTLHRAGKAKHKNQTHTQAASKTNFLLYFQTPRSTLRTLKFPLPQGRTPLFFLLV